MKPFAILLLIVSIYSCNSISKSGDDLQKVANNRPPLIQKPFLELPLGAIHPEGWLYEQLVRQKEGLTGNLDTIYAHVMGKRNGWLGGDGDVWERGPYWIDGLLPLAYILNDQELIDKTTPWIEWALNSQKENGYFGPDTDREYESGLQRGNSHDWWPKMVMLKVLQQYYSATGDQRVIELLLNYFKYQLKELPETPLDHWTFWGMKRGGDNLAVVLWLYNITGEEFLLDLAELIHGQTYDWTRAYMKGELHQQENLHCVNIAQGMKEPAVYYQLSEDDIYIKAIKMGLEDLREVHGMPYGLYGADEMLYSNEPTRGSEFCTAVEMMFSMETILPITGDVYFADQLEKVAFNALPAQSTDAFDARQYYQQANQVMVTRQPRNFTTTHAGTDLIFGQLTGYPCCTSNMHQGWPKFTQNLWYTTPDKGLAALIYAPSSVTTKVKNGNTVSITEETNYPFEEQIRFKINFDKQGKLKFPMYLRIPGWCNNATVEFKNEVIECPEAGTIIIINEKWEDGDILVLNLPMNIKISRWYNKSVSIEHGPLVYGLKIEEDWTRVENNDRYGDYYYEVKPISPWNYGLLESAIKDSETGFEVSRKDLPAGVYPWSPDNAPIKIITRGKIISDWKVENGSAGPLPLSPIVPDKKLKATLLKEITLIPYGCTGLRISEFPVIANE